MRRAPALQKGDIIQAIAPSRWVEEHQLIAAKEFLAKRGFVLQWEEGILTREGQFAGSDAHRAEQFNQAMAKHEVKALWAVRGGYGAQRFLPLLRPITEGAEKHFIGFSDGTAIHAWLSQQGILSWHAPVLGTLASTDSSDVDALFDMLEGGVLSLRSPAQLYNRLGKARGRLIGGNLSLVQSSLGSPYQEIREGDILFLEDLDEMLYHLDRMMLHLNRAGVFQKIAGLLIGSMSDMRDNTKAYGFSVDNPYGAEAYGIIATRIKDYDFPVAFGLPCGHTQRNFPLAMGMEVELEVQLETGLILREG